MAHPLCHVRKSWLSAASLFSENCRLHNMQLVATFFLYIFVMFLFNRKLGERERHTDQKLEEKSKRQRRLGNQIDFYFCQNVLMAQKGRTDRHYRGRTNIWLVALLWHLHYVSFATQNRTFLTDRWTWTWSQKANQLISQNMRNQYRQFIAW